MSLPARQIPPVPPKTDQKNIWLTVLGLAAAIAWALVFVNYFYSKKPNLAGGLAQVQLKGQTESWMGFYQADQPIGYNHQVIEPRGTEYFLTDEMVLKMNLLGEVAEIKTFMKSRLNLDWSIKDIELDMKSSAMNFYARATRAGEKLKIEVRAGGEPVTREIELKETPYLYTEPVFGEKLRQLGIKTGLKLSVPVFEPMTQAFDLASLEVGGREKVKLPDREISAWKVTETFRGQTEYLWITDSGEVVKEFHPSGFSAYKISRNQALELLSKSATLNLDLISALAIESNRYLENPRGVKYLKAKLIGPELSGLELDGDGQKLSGRSIEVMYAQPPARGYNLPFSGDAELEKYLAPDWQVQSNDTAIIQKTREVLQGEKDSVKAAAKLTSFVSGYVEDSMVAAIPSAVEVLNQRKGACKEHTVLFTAMARAAGIPARMAAGLVYSDAYLIKGFYYHAWAEVFLADADGKNGRWIRVDPTFNQFPADATHIRLKTGNLEAMISLMQVVGQTKIEVVEYQ